MSLWERSLSGMVFILIGSLVVFESMMSPILGTHYISAAFWEPPPLFVLFLLGWGPLALGPVLIGYGAYMIVTWKETRPAHGYAGYAY